MPLVLNSLNQTRRMPQVMVLRATERSRRSKMDADCSISTQYHKYFITNPATDSIEQIRRLLGSREAGSLETISSNPCSSTSQTGFHSWLSAELHSKSHQVSHLIALSAAVVNFCLKISILTSNRITTFLPAL